MTTTTAPQRSEGERSNRLILVLAVIAAAIAGILVFAALRSSGGSDNTASGSDVNVVVATRDLPADTQLKADMLDVKTVSSSLALEGSFTDSTGVIDKHIKYPLLKGEQITETNLGETPAKNEQLSISLIVPEGMRAVAVNTSEVSLVGGNLLPGDRVDLIAIFEADETRPYPLAFTVLQNVTVLAVAQEPKVPVPSGETPTALDDTTGRVPEDVKRNPGAQTVTIAVTPAQAQLLALVNKKATIQMSLRPRGEADATPVPLNPANLLEYSPPFTPRP